MTMLQVVEKAIKENDLTQANYVLAQLSPEELSLLPTHHINELPVLHYLARKRFVAGDHTELEKLIELYISNGYNINLRTEKYITRKRTSIGFTPLLASVEQSNSLFLLSLIKHGADVNVRDDRKLSACHWAVYVGDSTIFRTLIENGAEVATTESERLGEGIHPVLHTAIDEGRSDMLFYLLNNNLVDVNEAVTYQQLLSEASLTRFPLRYNCDDKFAHLRSEEVLYTPLARAVRMRKLQMIELLLKFNAKLSGFSELHFCITEGDTEVACALLDKFSDEELANDKIGDKWALHCLHPIAFQDESRLEMTKQLIYSYIDSGWDINSATAVPSNIDREDMWMILPNYDSITRTGTYSFSNYTFLHIACLYASEEFIQLIIKEEADVNVVTGEEGDFQMSPLHLCLLRSNWETAMMLLENGADPCSRGRIKLENYCFSRVISEMDVVAIREKKISLFDDSFRWFTGIELLLKIADSSPEAGLVFNEMMKKEILWKGAKELHIGIEGGNPVLICKVLDKVREMITLNELTWINFRSSYLTSAHIIPTPSFYYLLTPRSIFSTENSLPEFADLLEKFVELGYDCNLNEGGYCPLIFSLIQHQFKYLSNALVSQVLKFPHVRLGVRNEAGQSPVEYVLSLCYSRCIHDSLNCFKCKNTESYCHEVVKMLINHGADVSNVIIGESIKYHYGYEKMMKMLVSSGAKLALEFFSSPTCHVGYASTRNFQKELDQLQEWVKEKEKDKLSLKEVARLKVRSMLSSIGHLKILDELPEILRDAVLCKNQDF